MCVCMSRCERILSRMLLLSCHMILQRCVSKIALFCCVFAGDIQELCTSMNLECEYDTPSGPLYAQLAEVTGGIRPGDMVQLVNDHEVPLAMARVLNYLQGQEMLERLVVRKRLLLGSKFVEKNPYKRAKVDA